MAAQTLEELDRWLLREQSYPVLFQGKKILRSSPASDIRFAVNTRLIEAHLIARSPIDSMRPYIEANQTLVGKIANRYEGEYFKLIGSQALAPDPASGVESLQKISFSKEVLKARAYLKMGDWQQDLRKYPESLSSLLNALHLFRSDSLLHYFKIYRCHALLAITYRNLGKPEQAERSFGSALHILSEIPDPLPAEHVRILNNLGNVYADQRKFQLALKSYQESLRLKIASGQDSSSVASTCNNMANFHSRFGNYTDARVYYERALSYLPKPRSRQQLIGYNTIVSNYCNLLRDVNEFHRSKELVTHALKQSATELPADDPSLLRLRLRAAEDALSMHEPDEAHVHLNEATAIVQRIDRNDKLQLEYGLTLLSWLFRNEQLDSCLELSNALLKLLHASTEPDHKFQTYVLNKKGNVLEKLGRTSDAVSYYKESLTAAQKSGQRLEIITAWEILARAQFRNGQPDSARLSARSSFQLNEIPGGNTSTSEIQFLDENEAIACLSLQAEIAFQKFNASHEPTYLDEAVRTISVAIDLFKRKRESMLSETDRLEFGKYVDETCRLAADIYFESYRRNSDATSLHFISELMKSQALLSSLRKQQVSVFAGVSQAVNQREEKLAQEEKALLSDMAKQLASGPSYNDEVYQYERQRLQDLRSGKGVFLDSLARHLPGYFQLKYSQSLADLNTLRNAISPREALVEYVQGTQRHYGIVITTGEVYAWALQPSDKTHRTITQMKNLLRFRIEDGMDATEKALYNQLFAPVDSLLQLARVKPAVVMIVPDGELTWIPFEILKRNTRGKSSYLLESYSIGYNYSATLFWQKRTDPVIGFKKGWVGMAPNFGNQVEPEVVSGTRTEEGSAFTPLAETRDEVQSIAKLYERTQNARAIVLDSLASESTFKKLRFSELSVVHLATHGFAGLPGPRGSGVAFGNLAEKQEDNILFADEVYALHMPIELVTLSACETGLGKLQQGEGLIGLSRAFFYAGARSVLVSMWKVQDASTRRLMQSFYSYLFKGMTKTEALRQAKLDMIHSKEFGHPFYWSAFVLIGTN